uniref:RING-type domain-containing protein n=1 Tax=Caenorhabditis tropicalis TaxID=1561998 RepID=A0A1I7TTD2_9PELO
MGDDGVKVTPTTSNPDRPVGELQCTICLSSRFSQECRIHGCNHSFCFSCISEWVCQSLRPSCPMCRNEVEKILYDFAEQRIGSKEIGIREFRSKNMALDSTERNHLFGERRVVVRNLMHSYKLVGLLSSDITDIEESKEPDERLKNGLIELAAIITQHIQSAEIILADLRTDNVRKDKSVVLSALTFRRMIYSNKIKVKYPETKKPKLQPADIAKNPDLFRQVITNFLVAEFDAIPFQNQPILAGHKWRTKFLGGCISLDQKQRYADQIYDLIMATPIGNETFQNQLGEILSPVSTAHVKLLEDHLDAIIAVEKTSVEGFFKEVYYDSIYNSFSQNFFDYNAMLNLRDDPQRRFEAIFSQIHREMNPIEWLDPYSRLVRQTSNTGGTDRATNNDDSDRSDSPEERVPTPMPDDELRDHSLARMYFEHVFEIPTFGTGHTHDVVYGVGRDRQRRNRQHESFEAIGQTTRTLPITEQPRSHMTLRSSARRRLQAASEATNDVNRSADTHSRSRRETNRDNVSQRIRDLETQSLNMVGLFRPSHSSAFANQFNRWTYMSDDDDDDLYEAPSRRIESRHQHASSRPNGSIRDLFREANQPAPTMRPDAILPRGARHNRQASDSDRNVGNLPSTSASAVNNDGTRSLAEIIAEINQVDADNGLDFISVAHRTRSARRAARNGQLPEAPPAKRSTNSRRGRN